MNLLGKRFFLILMAVGVLYAALAFSSQKLLLWRLESGGEIRISGKNLTPLSLFSIRYQNLSLTYENFFTVQAKDAVCLFSPFHTLFGQIPLRIKGRDLSVAVKDPTFNSFFSGVPLETLNAKITVFCGKGVAVDLLNLHSDTVSLEMSGKLRKKGKGSSDLSMKLTVSPELMGKAGRFLTENLFSDDENPSQGTGKLTFRFRLRGDLAHPSLTLDSDLLRFDLKEASST